MKKFIFCIIFIFNLINISYFTYSNCIITVWEPLMTVTDETKGIASKRFENNLIETSCCIDDITVPLCRKDIGLKSHSDNVLEVLENNKLTEQRYLLLKSDNIESLKKCIKYANINKTDIFLITSGMSNLEKGGIYSKHNAGYTEEIYKLFNEYPNILFVISAGNAGINLDNEINQLKKPDNCIYVGALDYKGNKTKFSNYGEIIDFWTLGKNIYVSSIYPRELQKSLPETGKRIEGTSFSAPILTCILAKVKYNYPNYYGKYLKNELYNHFGKNILNEQILLNNRIIY